MGAVTSALCVCLSVPLSHVSPSMSFFLDQAISSPGYAVPCRVSERSFGCASLGSGIRLMRSNQSNRPVPIRGLARPKVAQASPPPTPPTPTITLSSPHCPESTSSLTLAVLRCASYRSDWHEDYTSSCRRGIVKDNQQVFRIGHDDQLLLFRS